MKCQITMPGDGIGKYGKPKKDRTGPIEEFIVDNGYFYPRVFAHVEKCRLCDPTKILNRYLERRLAKEEYGVTGTFVKLARRYYRLGRWVSKSLIREIEIRSGLVGDVDRSDFSLVDLAKAVRIACAENSWFSRNPSMYLNENFPDKDLILAIFPVVQGIPFKQVWAMTNDDESDLQKMIEVAAVMAS